MDCESTPELASAPAVSGFWWGTRARLPALHVLRSGSLARVLGVRFCNGGGGVTAAALAGDAGWSERVGLGVKVKVKFKVNGNVNDGVRRWVLGELG